MANVLANIFGSSPVMPLENHIGVAHKCARQLRDLFEAAISGDWQRADEIKAEIDRLENEADDIKKQIRMHLPKSLFMPVPRQDLLELLLVQDKIANRARDVAGIVTLRRMEIPPAIAESFLAFVDRVIDASRLARKSVRELDELFTAGFKGAEAELVSSMVETLDDVETDTDAREVQLAEQLFEIEGSLNPVDTIFIYKVLELIGDIADQAERVGRRLEMLLSN